MPTTVSCPSCGKKITWDQGSPWRPFCSERCKLLDLGDWLEENHRISESLDSAGGTLAETELWPELNDEDSLPRH